MKIPRNQIKVDVCQESIDLLRARCEKYLLKTVGPGPRWYADHYDLYERRLVSDRGVLDVVLFGSFFQRFMESGNWPTASYRLWVIGKAARSVLAELMKLPVDSVGLIPREELFPTERQYPDRPLSWLFDGRPLTLVHAGRVSAVKNIEMLLRTVHFLQKDHRILVRLVLCGAFDDDIHEDFGQRIHSDYEGRIRRLCTSLDWKIRPTILGKLPWDQWTRRDFVRPIFASFSTYISEDFGVSLAQAQQAGWPCLVTDWGGHRDVPDSDAVLKIPPLFIGHSHEPEQWIALKARHLAGWIASRAERGGTEPLWKRSARPEAGAAAPAPRPLLSSELDERRRAFIDKVGPAAQLISRRGLAAFADTMPGFRAFSAYRSLFSGPPPATPFTALVLNDLDQTGAPPPRTIARSCERLLRRSLAAGKPIVFLGMTETLSGAPASWLRAATEILIPYRSGPLGSLLETWIGGFGVSAPVTILADAAAPRRELSIAKAILRPTDRISEAGEGRLIY